MQDGDRQHMRQARFRVHGRVQGVAFRASAQDAARRLGLGGWIANRRDGSVSGMARGNAQGLDRFRQWLHDGPTAASVEAVDWELLPDDDDAPGDGDFTIAPDLP